ncbi:Hsp20/alpha crystallin family protein [Flavobacteriaceae bacterium 3-367]|uniref:Hsp20/alpha crystallin family protein n=1 Tax=Eudoraea algarum TaxID=3417568 RepID=UPI00327B3AED
MSLVKRHKVLFPSLMDEIFKPDWFGGMESHNRYSPAVNIRENEKDFVLELVAPGRKKADFNVEIDDHLLTVSVENSSESTTTEDNYTRKEFVLTSFKRAFSLPETIDETKINASYEDGVLRFTLPKREEALPKPKRLIDIA